MDPEQAHTSSRTHPPCSKPEQAPQSELADIVDLFARDSYEKRALEWYAIALLMEDKEQAWRVRVQELGGHRWWYFRTAQGDEFPLPDPGLAPEMEAEFAAAIHALDWR